MKNLLKKLRVKRIKTDRDNWKILRVKFSLPHPKRWAPIFVGEGGYVPPQIRTPIISSVNFSFFQETSSHQPKFRSFKNTVLSLYLLKNFCTPQPLRVIATNLSGGLYPPRDPPVPSSVHPLFWDAILVSMRLPAIVFQIHQSQRYAYKKVESRKCAISR